MYDSPLAMKSTRSTDVTPSTASRRFSVMPGEVTKRREQERTWK